MEPPDAALDDYFGIFNSTIDLAERLIREKRNAQEVLILLCARLDALASDSAPEGVSNKKAFSQFLVSYGGHRDLFESVSVSDLYYELGFHRWLVDGTIPKPGRLQRFSRVDDPIIHLLAESDIPLTVKDATQLLTRIMATTKAHFRVLPRQARAKRPLAKLGDLEKTIAQAFKGPRLKEVGTHMPKAVRPLLESKRVATVLYERFRSGSIHGAKVLLDEDKFFEAREPYWTVESSPYFGAYQLIEFPAAFLVGALRNCLRTYRAHLLAKGKLPPDILFHVFEDESLNYLELMDQDLLPPARSVKLKNEP